MSELVQLKSLDVRENMLGHDVPIELGKLEHLSSLRLAYNQFVGSSINSIAAQNLGLKELNISNNLGIDDDFLRFVQNKYTRDVPRGVSRAIEVLDVSNCSLRDQIPAGFFSYYCDHLSIFHADDNELFGTINLTEIQTLSVFTARRNRISWTLDVPTSIFVEDDFVFYNESAIPRLQQLDLSYNALEASIPTFIGHLTTLTKLELQGNNIAGKLPAALGKLDKLVVLDVSENDFEGNLPSELGKCTSLQSLLVHDNRLRGTVPTELFQLSTLRTSVIKLMVTCWKVTS